VRTETWTAGALVEVIEVFRVSGTPTWERRNGVGAVLATRAATDAETAALVAEEDDTSRDLARQRIKTTVAALRQWKVDADVAVAAWDGRTVAQNIAVLKTVTDRFGVLADNLADLLTHLRVDE
jgi:hypothetical protein